MTTASEPTNPAAHARRRDLERLEASSNPELTLVQLSIERIAASDPELATAVRYASIPRRFDAEIIAVLGKESPSSEAAQRVFGGLVALPFVTKRRDGAYALHDATRDLLIAEWCATPESREQFAEYNRSLAQYYVERRDRALGLDADFDRVTSMLLHANRERHQRLAARVEAEFVVPLLEALYHHTLIDTDEGFDFFSNEFQAYEQRGRLSVCRALLRAFEDDVQRHPARPDASKLLLWVEYYRGRLEQGLNNHGKAERILRELLDRVGDDVKLKLWTLSGLGNSLSQQSRLSEALPYYEEELALGRETRTDPFNTTISHSRLGDLYSQLRQPARAAAAYREAISTAVDAGNGRAEAFARVNLATVLRECEAWEAAYDAALLALDCARHRLRTDDVLQHTVARCFAELFSRRDPRLQETLFHEHAALLTGPDAAKLVVELRSSYGDLSRSAGLTKWASERLAETKERAATIDEFPGGSDMMLREALLLGDRGETDEAIRLYTDLIESTRDDPNALWTRAAALSNRGDKQAEAGRWAESDTDLLAATSMWESIGHDNHIALMKLNFAAMLRRRARSEHAQRLIDASPVPGRDEVTPRAAIYYESLADVARYSGRWTDAIDNYRRAFTMNERLRRLEAVARCLAKITAVATSRCDWVEAGRYAHASVVVWRELEQAGVAEREALPPLPDGALDEVTRLLVEARGKLSDDSLELVFRYERLRGDVDRDLRRFGDAEEHYRSSLNINRLLDRTDEVGRTLSSLASVANDRGDWHSAGEFAEEAAAIYDLLLRMDAYRPTEDQTRANSLNARGIAHLTASRGDADQYASRARDFFVEAAQIVPDNVWFHLNASFALAHTDDWGVAAHQIEGLATTPAVWLRSPRLDEWMVDYALRHVRALTDLGRADEAAAMLARARRRIEALRPGPRFDGQDLASLRSRLGDALLRLGSIDAGAEQYRLAVAGAEATLPTPLHKDLIARLAIAAALSGDLAGSVDEMRRALDLGMTPSAIVDISASIASAREQRSSVSEALRRLAAAIPPDRAADVRAARLDHAGAKAAGQLADLPQSVVMSSSADAILPVTTPIGVEADDGLFAGYDDVGATHPLFQTWFPAMRERIHTETGLRVPGVRVRSITDVSAGAYSILVDEVPLTIGTIEVDRVFVPDVYAGARFGAHVVDASELRPNPLNDERSGVWLDGATAATLPPGRTSWSAFEYMTRHIEVAVRANLEVYFGVQELAALLDEWEAAATPESDRATRHERIAAATPDLAARLRLLAVLRRLIHEDVPIRRLDEILERVTSLRDETEPTRVAEAIRLVIRDELPGNRGEAADVLVLSDVFESAIADNVFSHDGKEVFAIPPALTQELQSAARNQVVARDRPVVILTRRPGIRPYVRRLIELEFPRVIALARDELTGASEPAIAGRIALDDEPEDYSTGAGEGV